MVLSTLFFAVMHASVRHVGALGLHPFEIAFFRNLFGLLVVLPWLVRLGFAVFRTRRLGLHGLRAAVNAAAMLLFFYALTIAPLTQVTALAFTAPVFAALLAVLFLKERVGIGRWLAIMIAFLGTLVILRPGLETPSLGSLLTLLAAVGWAIVLLIVKVLGRTESSIGITAYMSLLIAPIALVPALGVWQWPTPHQLTWLVAIGIAGSSGQILLTQALKSAETHVVMPFDFFRLIWIAILSYLAFAEIPDLFTWVGGLLIFAGAGYITLQERRLEQRARSSATPQQ